LAIAPIDPVGVTGRKGPALAHDRTDRVVEIGQTVPAGLVVEIGQADRIVLNFPTGLVVRIGLGGATAASIIVPVGRVGQVRAGLVIDGLGPDARDTGWAIG
jgi:hypothetical protein